MKRIKKIIMFLILICSILSFSGCLDVWGAIFHQCPMPPPYDDPSDYPEYPDYQSAYTEEEHIARLTEITESGAWEDLEDQLLYDLNYRIDYFQVEIVYALYDNDPEFFLIDLASPYVDNSHTIIGKVEETNEGFIFGYILNDEYYVIALHAGKNPWEYAGYPDTKKYFGSYCYAVEIDGEMTVVFEQDSGSRFLLGIGNIVSYILSEQYQKDYMEYNYLQGDYRKYEMKELSIE